MTGQSTVQGRIAGGPTPVTGGDLFEEGESVSVSTSAWCGGIVGKVQSDWLENVRLWGLVSEYQGWDLGYGLVVWSLVIGWLMSGSWVLLLGFGGLVVV